MRKITFMTGFAAGYVLGARAGVERYEQIKQAAASFRSNPKVQETVEQIQTQAGTLATQAKDKVSGGGGDAGEGTDDQYDVVEMPGTYAQAGSNGRMGV